MVLLTCQHVTCPWSVIRMSSDSLVQWPLLYVSMLISVQIQLERSKFLNLNFVPVVLVPCPQRRFSINLHAQNAPESYEKCYTVPDILVGLNYV